MKKFVVALRHDRLPGAAGPDSRRAGLPRPRSGLGRGYEQGALPGATVTLRNDATGVAATNVTNTEGRYIFDFVDPGTYTRDRPSCQGFKQAEQQNVRVQQRATLTVDLTLERRRRRRDASSSRRRR